MQHIGNEIILFDGDHFEIFKCLDGLLAFCSGKCGCDTDAGRILLQSGDHFFGIVINLRRYSPT